MFNIPYCPFHCYIGNASNKIEKSTIKLSMYFDRFTYLYGCYFQVRGIVSAHLYNLKRPFEDQEKSEFRNRVIKSDGVQLEDWNESTASWAVLPLRKWNNRQLFSNGKILTGTLSGAMNPVVLGGVNGALTSGKIAATAVRNRKQAIKEFKNINPYFNPQFTMKKLVELTPHFVKKPLLKSNLFFGSTHKISPSCQLLMWPPGFDM